MLLATLALLAAPQATVTETVTLNRVPSAANAFNNYGLPDVIDESHGTPVGVTVSSTIQVDTSGTWTNTGSTSGVPFFWMTDLLGPNVGDCRAYVELNEQTFFPQVAPGQTLDLTTSRTYPMSFTAPSTFLPICTPSEWLWTDLVHFPNPGTATGFYDGNGLMSVPGATVQVTIDGTFTFEYEPTPLPSVSVCPGNQPGGAPLVVGGSPERPWFIQSNAPSTVGIIVVSTTASTTVPPDGLCITRGGGRFARLTDPANLAAAPVQGELPASLAGTTLFFQSWMAGAGGAAPTTGECVAVQLP